MECELWDRLYVLVWETAKECRRSRVQFSDAVILLVFLWAALHDRPVSWACQAKNWTGTRSRPVCFPSDSTMSRRLKTASVLAFESVLAKRIRGTADWDLIELMDGKSLPIGGCSKDPDARWGRAAHGMAYGYKLHSIWSSHWFPDAWDVRPLNVNEARVAHDLVPQLEGSGYILADTQYDSSPLHDLCRSHHYQLVAPSKRTATGRGHTYQSPHRRHAMEMLNRKFGQGLIAIRRRIETLFGNITSFGAGLAPLPAWVRRSHRVKRWVWAKLLINATRIRLNQRLTA
jgi:hypothetical protein